ncbi:MAG TPA: NAD-dependent malic enzyme [Nanoarchaeota archaeon]|nr:NAD-dependent malic enzyme [Candidatus Woesearchaeota archaeon]HIH59481.1 NAD-dependent malic enzyme [Nanoarchaeota archaeon]HII14232.1 NAD-dependent malic enzyme [Nanoarchaeota archaeon]HIJ04628.1 NAD-dependent malic enzyme [Nanoarchaeota archaeon]
MDYKKESISLHKQHRGKLAIQSKFPLLDKKDLSLAYTPGVAGVCEAIVEDTEKLYTHTMKGNSVAVITDGSAVLGLGNIGSAAGLPVMEGKAILFKEFADIDAFPICLASQDVRLTIATIKNIAPAFGGINLEDIKAPECFVIEEALQDLGIPVMHDDQHGTAVVVLAGMINALKVKKKDIADVKIVVNGAGAAGIAITKLLLSYGAKGLHFTVCDSKGIIYFGREDFSSTPEKQDISQKTNLSRKKGNLEDALRGADVFIGVSKKDLVTKAMVQSMAKHPILFAMANPDPEILPTDAKEAGAFIVATGRSDFPNQVNNALAFPGIFRGALDVRATKITEKMKLAAAEAIASMIEHPTPGEIIPSPLLREVVVRVSEAVQKAWKEELLIVEA